MAKESITTTKQPTTTTIEQPTTTKISPVVIIQLTNNIPLNHTYFEIAHVVSNKDEFKPSVIKHIIHLNDYEDFEEPIFDEIQHNEKYQFFYNKWWNFSISESSTEAPKNLEDKKTNLSEILTTRAPHWTQIVSSLPSPNPINSNGFIETTIAPKEIKTTTKLPIKSEEYEENEEEEDLFFWKSN